MSLAVAARTRDLSIRMALGAWRLDVVGVILRGGSVFTAADGCP